MTPELRVAKVLPIMDCSAIHGISFGFVLLRAWEQARGLYGGHDITFSVQALRLKASVHDAASLLSQLKISSAAFSRSETAQSCGRRCVKGQKTLQPHQNVYFVLLSVSFRRICASLAEREGAEHSELDRQDASTPYPSTGDTCVTERLSAAFPGLSKLRQLYAFLSWF